MGELSKERTNEKKYNRDWKEKSQEYIQALQKFLDVTDNINDESIKLEVIYKMLSCDEILTKLAEVNMN